MRARLSGILIALTLLAVLAVPLGRAAQDETAQAAQPHHYKLIDLGTFGGPNSFFPAPEPPSQILAKEIVPTQ